MSLAFNLGKYGEYNTCIGIGAGGRLSTGSHNLFIGHNAGADVVTGSDLVIIGDDIRSPIYPNQRVSIGPVLFGEVNPLYSFIECGMVPQI